MRGKPIRFGTAIMIAALAACSGDPAQKSLEQPRAILVRTVTAERKDLDRALELTGTLRPRSQVQVVAEVSARLLQVNRDEGARVSKGDVLAVLDDTDYALAEDRSKAALAVADANRAHAVVEKERADSLLKTGGITDKDHLAAQVSLQVGDAALAQARAEAAIAGEQHARCQVKAVFNGRIARRLADPGAMLAAGAPIFTLIDDAVLEFRSSVPSEDYDKLKVGDSVQVTVDVLPGYALNGRVARITPFVDDRSRAFDVVVEVPGNDKLVGGLFARASVKVGSVPGAIVLPPAALIRDSQKPSEAGLFVVRDGKAEKRTVTIGVEGPERIQVAKGVEAGDVIVLDPPVALTSGAVVEIRNQ